jgi:hypothetical protein
MGNSLSSASTPSTPGTAEERVPPWMSSAGDDGEGNMASTHESRDGNMRAEDVHMTPARQKSMTQGWVKHVRVRSSTCISVYMFV